MVGAIIPAVLRPQPKLQTLAQVETAHILKVLDAVGGNKKEAARVLEISRGTLYRKLEEAGLTKE